MPWYVWMALGAAVGVAGSAAWLVWYFRDVYR